MKPKIPAWALELQRFYFSDDGPFNAGDIVLVKDGKDRKRSRVGVISETLWREGPEYVIHFRAAPGKHGYAPESMTLLKPRCEHADEEMVALRAKVRELKAAVSRLAKYHTDHP